ncbi:hypothetical protein BJV78DRAFT_1222794 [Lactifluus subvellereus]|nr:hypothetical protein BJV78DRAFT_1222794 [Lactifluus subvellereus]
MSSNRTFRIVTNSFLVLVVIACCFPQQIHEVDTAQEPTPVFVKNTSQGRPSDGKGRLTDCINANTNPVMVSRFG